MIDVLPDPNDPFGSITPPAPAPRGYEGGVSRLRGYTPAPSAELHNDPRYPAGPAQFFAPAVGNPSPTPPQAPQPAVQPQPVPYVNGYQPSTPQPPAIPGQPTYWQQE